MTTPSSRKMKASDRQSVIRRVMSLLQKKYGRSLPKSDRDVLHTLLFGITLENASQDAAEAALANLIAGYHDLNEIRVSSVTELEGLLTAVPQSDWKALRIREALQFTFEKYYNFDLEPLRRKTMDIAEKQLAKVGYLTPFARNYVLQHSLGSHVVPVDDATRIVIQWLGLAAPETDNDSAAEEVKSALRKPDAVLFCHLLRSLVTDRRYAGTFSLDNSPISDGEPEESVIVERLKQHMAHPPRIVKKTVKKSRKRPPVAERAAKRSRTSGGTVRKKVSKPKASGSRRR